MFYLLRIFAFGLLLVFPLWSAEEDTCTSVELASQKAFQRHQFIFSLAKTFRGHYRVHPNQQEKKYLLGYTYWETGLDLDGEKLIEIPASLVEVWDAFNEIIVRGRGLENLRFAGVSPLLTEAMTPIAVNDKTARFSRLSILPKVGVTKGYYIRFQGQGRIESISLMNHQEHALDPEFDWSPFRSLGEDQPILKLQLRVDPSVQRFIGGVSHLDRSKYMRLYNEPLREDPEITRKTASMGFLPGRQQFKFNESLEQGYVKGQPQLREDPERPGYTDLSFFKNYRHEDFTIGTEKGFGGYKNLGDFYPPDLKFAMCFDGWPSFMNPKNVNLRNERGTPDNHHAAAELAAEVVAKQLELSGRTAHWWEVKNESDIGYEWMWHDAPQLYDSWGLLADFHGKVAGAIKKRCPKVQVGGPASAWMAFEVDDFRIAKNHLRFMDLTSQSLDFYSHHFYEPKGLISAQHTGSTFLHGRLRAILDLLFNHMQLSNNKKPLLITEYGVLHDGPQEIDQWIAMKSYGSYMIQLMNQPDRIDLAVPFILPVLWWHKGWKTGLYGYLEDEKTLYPTRQMDFLKFWQDYEGYRILSEDDEPGIYSHAVRQGNEVFIAVNNVYGRRVALNLKLQAPLLKVERASQQRLYFDRAQLKSETHEIKSLSDDIPMAVDETCIIRLQLKDAPEPQRALDERLAFGDSVLVKTGAESSFKLNAETQQLASAKLRIACGKSDGISSQLSVDWNGHRLDTRIESPKGQRHLGVVEFSLPVDAVKSQNLVKLRLPQEGARISSVVFVGNYHCEVKLNQ